MTETTSFFEELKRRNVVRVGVVYLIAAWLLAQVADLMLENFQAPDWVIQAILVVLIIGFPIALIFAWAFELTPEGLKKERDVDRSQSITHKTGHVLDRSIIAILVIALGYFVWESRFDDESVGGRSAAEQGSGRAQSALLQNGTDSSEAGGRSAAEQDAGREHGSLLQKDAADKTSAKSIAVLPFVNMSSDPEQEYFSDGISEEILNALAKVKDLKVAGRTSSFAFKGENQDLRVIGEALGVENILEGSVRKSGDKVRITAQLIQVDDGFHLWSESYDREMTDVFEIQDEIANAILEQLKLHLLDEQPQLVETTRANTEAYDLYLLAKQRMYERTGPTIESAVELLDRAIAIDPNYAPAYAQRGIAALLLREGVGSYGNIPTDQALTQGKLYLDKALQLDPELAEAWAGMGLYHNSRPLGVEKSEAPLRKALELNPGMMDASNWLYISLNALGRPLDAKDVVEQMIERDPLYRPGVRNAINSFVWFGEYDKAEAYIERIRPLIPNDATILSSQAAINFDQGHYAQSMQQADQAIALQPSNSVARITRGFNLMATQQLDRLLEQGEEWQPIIALTLLNRTEEASLLAFKRAEQMADAGTLFNVLNLAGRSAEVVEYLEERWPNLDALEKDFPPWAGTGHLMMLDVALAYSRTGNEERFNDAQSRTLRTHQNLIDQGIDNPLFFMSEASYYAMAGNPDTSLEFLDRAISRGFISTATPITREFPYLKTLEGDPRFEAIQVRMIEHLNAERAELGLEPVNT